MSIINEEALDLSNDLINNNLVLPKHSNSINDRSNVKWSIKSDSRINDSTFFIKNEPVVAQNEIINQFPIPQNDQTLTFPVNCVESSRILSVVNEGDNDLSRLVNQTGLRAHEKLTEYFAQAYQEQQQQQQISHLQSILAAILTSSPNNVMAPWLSTKNALTSILQQLPAPTSSLSSFSSLHSLYASIQNTCVSLDKLLEQYFILFISAFLKTQEKSILNPHLLTSMQQSREDNSMSKTSSNNLKRKSVSPQRNKSQKSPNSIDYQSTYSSVNLPADDNSNLYNGLSASDPSDPNLSIYIHNSSSRLFKRKKITQNGNKKSNFRGTSEAENEIDTLFMPREVNREIILCEEYPNVHLDKEVYNTLTSKAPRSATRLIRLLMKHFFSQDTLARSSLSGEGIYKDRLQPDVIEAIKLFIKRRHPKLKNGSINLCMTDVCVQARRVNKNQRTRLPSSTDVNSKTADSAMSDGYSPTMFSGISMTNGTGGGGGGGGGCGGSGSGIGCGVGGDCSSVGGNGGSTAGNGYNLLTTGSGHEIGTKPNSPESGNNSLSSREQNNTGSHSPFLMTSTTNQRSSPDTFSTE